MTDKRELILVRIFDVLDAIPPLVGYSEHTVARNRGVLPDDKRPTLLLLDGTEEVRTFFENKGRMFMTPAVMTLLPQIFVVLKEKLTPANEGVGPEISAFRAAVIKAISRDATLATLCGSNGQVSLRRVETDMQTGRSMEGQIQFDFAFDYVLDPGAL